MSMVSGRIQNLIGSVITQFDYRTKTEGKKHGVNYGITLNTTIDVDNVLWLTFTREDETHNITIPLPFERGGIQLIQQDEVVRAVCPFWLEEQQLEIDYLAAMYSILMDVPHGLVSESLIKATPFIQQVVYGFVNNNTSIVIYKLQKAINELVNKMPLHETNMNSYVMNNRLIIIDREFDELRSPGARLEYQTNKARKYFSRGWTALGLSDGTLADKNYILKKDLRKLSPFGIRYHNPQRNLYSTLGMKGDELPNIRSKSMQELMDNGISRKGWNLFTAFVDVPDIFEDQILIDSSHKGKFITEERRLQVYGTLKVKVGDKVRCGQTIGIAPDQEAVKFKTLCDSARVSKISESVAAIGGVATLVYNVVIEYRRNFKDGTKVTNLHGNKGVIRIRDLGYAIHPRTGAKRKIDVIVGAKTVGKRKNYGQIMEALASCVLETDRRITGVQAALIREGYIKHAKPAPVILDDDWYQPMEEVVSGLTRRGFNSDGTWQCDTYLGKLKAICGTVFWGCIKMPEDQIWQDNTTINRNGKEVRTAGLKFSHVELRAIQTRFGNDSAVMDEVMSYVQGTENVDEQLWMLRSNVGLYPENKPLLNLNQVRPMDQVAGTIVPGQCIGGTVVDEFFFAEGFLIQLPLPFQTLLDDSGSILHEGPMVDFNQVSPETKLKIAECYTIDKLYFPSGILRKCWRHDSGKFGLSEVGVIINNVVIMSHRLVAAPEDPLSYRRYYGAIETYFNKLAYMMGSKRGDISTYTMAVRYPFSAKAVATLSTTLPKNTIEIHRDMARALRVNNGDVVITERFPCLGFMSVRPQKVRITDDPLKKYVISASGNSLVSQNLDFDGDVLFIASFHTPHSKVELMREWTNPNKTCYDEITKLNNRKGAPHTKVYVLDDFAITPFADMTCDEHAAIVEKNTGVKAQTGPVIALTYNIMRIVEASGLASDQKMKVAVEMFLEKAAQSVFEQKHGGRSLYEIVIDGVCTADVDMLVEVGFKRGTTEKLCDLIVNRANALGIFDLRKYHENSKKSGGSNIISTIVKNFNKIYFASRSRLHGIALLKALSEPAVDVPSRMFKWAMAGKIGRKKTMLDEITERESISNLKSQSMQQVCETLFDVLDRVGGKAVETI